MAGGILYYQRRMRAKKEPSGCKKALSLCMLHAVRATATVCKGNRRYGMPSPVGDTVAVGDKKRYGGLPRDLNALRRANYSGSAIRGCFRLRWATRMVSMDTCRIFYDLFCFLGIGGRTPPLRGVLLLQKGRRRPESDI